MLKFSNRYLEEASDGEGSTGGNDDAAAVAAALGGEGEGDAAAVGDESKGWNLSDGVAGEGEAPDWFKGDKYKSVSEQAKAYNELEGKFGSFTGAPDEYVNALSEELQEAGVFLDDDDPMLETAMAFAKESGMNQEGFNNLINMYGEMKLAEANELSAFHKTEIESLGAKGQQRIDNLQAWGSANMPSELMEGFKELAQSAEGVKAMERMISMTRAAPISADANGGSPSVTEAEIRAMQFEKDEYGNRRIQTDPDFKAKYNKAMNDYYGGAEHSIVVG